jgi:hypothetical protein
MPLFSIPISPYNRSGALCAFTHDLPISFDSVPLKLLSEIQGPLYSSWTLYRCLARSGYARVVDLPQRMSRQQNFHAHEGRTDIATPN